MTTTSGIPHGEVGAWDKLYPINKTHESHFFDDWEGATTFIATTGEPLPIDPLHIPPTSIFEMLLNDEAMISALKERRISKL